MPVSAAVNDLFQVRIRGHIHGQETNNVLNFKCKAASADIETHLIIVLIQCFITELLPALSSDFVLQDVIWKRTAPTLSPEFIHVPTGTLTGGGDGAALPSYCSAVISIRTNEGGRSKRGRMYIPGIPENQTLDSNIDPSAALWAALLAFLTCLATNFFVPDPTGTDKFQLIVYSRKLGGASFPYTQTGVSEVTSLTRVAALGTTRSRKVGRGS